jgi:hypothetical protein
MKPRYRVTLTSEERVELEVLTRTGKTNAKRFLYARALLLCDAGPQGPAWTVADTAEAMGVTARTIEHLKKRFVEEGLDVALERRKPEKAPRGVTFDSAFEARLITLACSEAPQGRRRWTVRLLAERTCAAKRKQDFGVAFEGRSHSHVGIDSPQICCVADCRSHQGQERDSYCQNIRWS